MKYFKIAVFASGNGSNFQAIVDHFKDKNLNLKIELLVTDKPNAPVVKRAEDAYIPVFSFNPKEYKNRKSYEKVIVAKLQHFEIDLIVLAGFMRILTEELIKPYYGKVINIHPSLLPLFPGKNAIEEAFAHGVKKTGVTIHFVDEGVDSGPIIMQKSIDVREEDSIDTLRSRIHKVEHTLLPLVIELFYEGLITLSGSQIYKEV